MHLSHLSRFAGSLLLCLATAACARSHAPIVLEFSCPPPPSSAPDVWHLLPSGEVAGAILIDGEHPAQVGRVTLEPVQAGDSLVRVSSQVGYDGRFALAGVRPGRYRLKIWASGGLPMDREIAVGPGGDTVRVSLGHDWIC